MTKRLMLMSLIVGLLLTMWALPGAAQEEAGPFYTPENGAVDPVTIERDEAAPRAEDPDQVTEVAEAALARTGVPVTVGMALALGLFVLGGGALLASRRRQRFSPQ